jgi:hypothetical protein
VEQRPKKLLDLVRDAARLKHYSIRTEEAYVGWIRRFIIRTVQELLGHKACPACPGGQARELAEGT